MDQERSMVREEKAVEERQKLRGNVSELTRGIRKNQGAINELRGALKRVDRIDESIKVQLRGVNDDILFLKEEVVSLKESVSLMGAVSISGEGEAVGAWIEDAENVARLEGIIKDVIKAEMPSGVVAPPEPEPIADLPPLAEDVVEEEEEEVSFLSQYGIWLALIGGLVLVAVAAVMYMKMNSGEVEEEDDIVVEETA